MTDTTLVTTPPAAVKPAWRTTEGWMALATGLIGALVTAHFIADGGTVATVAGMAMTLVATMIHSWSRTKIKTAGWS